MLVLTYILYNRKNTYSWIICKWESALLRVLWLYKDLYTRESVYHLLGWFHISWDRQRLILRLPLDPQAFLMLFFIWQYAQSLSRVRLFATPWTVARQAPLSLGFSKREYWSGLPCPSPGNLSHPGIQPVSPLSLSLASGFFTIVPPKEP